MLDYGNLHRSLKNLELQNDNRKNLPPGLPRLLREAVDDFITDAIGLYQAVTG